MTASAEATVVRFNSCINRRDLAGLAELMTDDHRFVDVEGNAVEGKAACVDAWRSFFEAFPDYRNHFEQIDTDGDEVSVRGASTCSVAELDGPARWSAIVDRGQVREWRVRESTVDEP